MTRPSGMRCDRCTPCDCDCDAADNLQPAAGEVPPLEYLLDPEGWAGRFVQAKLAEKQSKDPYFNDRPYPNPEDWADGANPFARPHPELQWVWRALPNRSCAGWLNVIYLDHLPTVHDFPITPPPETGPRRVAVHRPERVA